jgi:hypothetical protein
MIPALGGTGSLDIPDFPTHTFNPARLPMLAIMVSRKFLLISMAAFQVAVSGSLRVMVAFGRTGWQ